MSAMSDGEAGDAAFEPFEFADVDFDHSVVELSEHLRRLWALAGDQKSAVSEMHDVRARLFGYGQVRREG